MRTPVIDRPRSRRPRCPAQASVQLEPRCGNEPRSAPGPTPPLHTQCASPRSNTRVGTHQRMQRPRPPGVGVRCAVRGTRASTRDIDQSSQLRARREQRTLRTACSSRRTWWSSAGGPRIGRTNARTLSHADAGRGGRSRRIERRGTRSPPQAALGARLANGRARAEVARYRMLEECSTSCGARSAGGLGGGRAGRSDAPGLGRITSVSK